MRKITKKIYEHGIFVDKQFIIISNSEKLDISWLQAQYGNPRYLVSWWKTHTEVGFSEKVYVHYTLCH